MSDTKEHRVPKVGEVWRDNDPRRAEPRLIEIIAVDRDYVRIKTLGTGRTSDVLLKRFRPTMTGYVFARGGV